MIKRTKKKVTKLTKRSRQPKREGSIPKTKNWELTLEKINQYIKERAYYIWEEEGKPEGKNLEIWVRAEKEILSKLTKR